jgi:formylglycine-generating enzyme required for sulfatase activity
MLPQNALLKRFVATILALSSWVSAYAVPLYHIIPLGIDDSEHTGSNGGKSSGAYELNQAGHVLGYSYRFYGGNVLYHGNKPAESVWLYNGAASINIGLTDAEHTRDDGYKYSYVGPDFAFNVNVTGSGTGKLNEAGQVVGSSYRFNGDATDLGRSVWFYNGANTIKIGLTGPEHTSSNGRKYSYERQLNDAGQIIGSSSRYDGINDLGPSAWLYNGTTTINIGLIGPEYTRNDGFQWSGPQQLNDSGQVLGLSARFVGSPEVGTYIAWLYNGTTTIDIGLAGAEYTRSDGYRHSYAERLNAAGQAIGYSSRYNGGVDLGSTAWLYNGTTTIPIGLTGAEHTHNSGVKSSTPYHLNNAGHVAGVSYRYNGGTTDLGVSAWLYNRATTVPIGLTGPEHTRNDGYKSTYSQHLNQAGIVSGYSLRYNGGSADLGHSAWLYNGATTVPIGLTGAEHTRNDDYKYSYPNYPLNEAGQVSGFSLRYNGGSTELGRSAWLYDGAATVPIGFAGPEHTRNDGYKYSQAERLNEAGQVTGSSSRYIGSSVQKGQDAWFYDSTLQQTFTLQLSQRSSGGYAFSRADYLGEDGLVLGTYTLFDALHQSTFGNGRAFYFTVADGLHDLGALVDGGLSTNGWASLASALRANGLGQILGHGRLTSPSASMAYLLTPVPEPSTIVLAAAGLGLLFARRRRRAPLRSVALVLGALVVVHPAPAVTIDTVPIGNPGNASDTRYIDEYHASGVGAVAYEFRMGATEITNAQYVAFLNAVAASDPYDLYDWLSANSNGNGIVRSGAPGSYSYAVKPPNTGHGPGPVVYDYPYDNKPVVFVSIGDVMRFANWLHNGQPTGPPSATTTEDGAYTLNGAYGDFAIASVSRNPGARWWLPDENEWYKAAYFDPDAGVYYDFPAGTNTVPNNNQPSADTGNSANFYDPARGTTFYDICCQKTDAGAYTLSASPYGTFDQGGNVWEWNERLFIDPVFPENTVRGMRGGDSGESAGWMHAANWSTGPYEESYLGFRLATIPELSGDFNHDNTVDAADYVDWRKNPGGIYTPDDYTTWRANFGQTFSVGTGASSAFSPPPSALDNSVPEPSALALAAMCIIGLATFARGNCRV